MRPIVSYDDISYDNAIELDPVSQQDTTGQPPAKKQKKKHNKSKQQSRELTHAEVWDDSSLIDAWNAANEEYEAYHGPGKSWKNEPTIKSSLWYNVPRSVTDPATSSSVEDGLDVQDSQPFDFDTFVPTHDPSLDLPTFDQPPPVPGPDYSSYYLPAPPGPMVSRDEAFTRALGAMYWGGYWTAVYHCQSTATQKTNAEDDEAESSDYEVQGEIEDLVPTQRAL